MKIVDQIVTARPATKYVQRKITEHSSCPTSKSWDIVPAINFHSISIIHTKKKKHNELIKNSNVTLLSISNLCSLQVGEWIVSLEHMQTLDLVARILVGLPFEQCQFQLSEGLYIVLQWSLWSPMVSFHLCQALLCIYIIATLTAKVFDLCIMFRFRLRFTFGKVST